ncbi:MAG: hypothetical protein HY791_39265 [Deltaproteobacteria bacterium]|nr:hypothetical protein [Deltaproteobacteria bacterium]
MAIGHMRFWLAAPAAVAFLGAAQNASAIGDGRMYALQSDAEKLFYQIDVTGAGQPTIQPATDLPISKNVQPFATVTSIARDPETGAVLFTENSIGSGLAAFDPSLSTVNGGPNDCRPAPLGNPSLCQFLLADSPATSGNPRLAGRLGFRFGPSASDPRLFGAAQNLPNEPLYTVGFDGIAVAYGQPTVGGVPFSTGAGGDHTFNAFDINCTGPSPFMIPAGTMFIIQNAASPSLWKIDASEFKDCDAGTECNLELTTLTTDVLNFGSARPTGMAFDMNTNVAIADGKQRLWVAWSDRTLAALNPCNGIRIAPTVIKTPRQVADLADVVQPITGFTVVGCSSTEGADWADVLILGLLPLFWRRRKAA